MSEILQKILLAKENRASLRETFSAKGLTSISLSLNVVGYPKTNKNLSLFFELVLNELKTFLLANKILLEKTSEKNIIDEAGDFFISAIKNNSYTSYEIKEITEEFEQNHDLGRFIDVDISDTNGNYISSNKLKLCYFCNEKPAIVCMREKTHSNSELRNFMFEKVERYLYENNKKNIIEKLSSFALKSILYEVSLSPKPGLVNFNNSGSHKDMDYYTFLNSSSALAQYFIKFADLAYGYKEDFSQALPKIRIIGLDAEKAMFKETNGVNTQKGIIFLMGISLFSASYVFSNENEFSISSFSDTVKKVCKNIVKEELQNVEIHKTHGELCFKKYGLKGAGARFEVEQGFPMVVNFALPTLEKFFKGNEKEEINFALRKTLLALISENNDTNVLYRKGNTTLEELKKLAKNALKNDDDYIKVCNFCEEENISPGGSADLLAISLFLHFTKEYKNEF